MKVAITGGSGFVGGHLARRLADAGHDVITLSSARGVVRRPSEGGRVVAVDITDVRGLTKAFTGCDAVVHCAGINRQIGTQTYERVHAEGTAAVVEAARRAGVARIAMVSFLRARPDGPDEYHRSKWAAEEIVRTSGLSWTVLKCGVIYGRGDHLLDHVTRALRTLPFFGLVGMRHRSIRPVAVDDVARVLEAAALGDIRLADQRFAVLGPEPITLRDAVRRIGKVIGKRPLIVPTPVFPSVLFAYLTERTMRVPLVAVAQARILAEGAAEPLPDSDALPVDLTPRTRFTEQAIRSGLPDDGGFGLDDFRCSLPRWAARFRAGHGPG